MQTPPSLLLSGWSERTKLYQDISKVSLLGELLELRLELLELLELRTASEQR